MAHINDVYGGNIAYYQANGATSNDLDDAEREFLIANGGVNPVGDPQQHENDMWFYMLGIFGYTGALDDRQLKFWEGGGVIPAIIGAFTLGFDAGFF